MVHIELKTVKSLDFSKSPKEYDILISTSLFMMKESYRNFSKYVYSFLKWFPYIPKNTCVRIYVDVSVLDNEDFQKIMDLKSSHLEIVQFHCDEFFDEANNLHDGTFGSIIRLLPLYEKPYNVKYVWISDTDMPSKLFSYKPIKEMKNNNAKVFYYSRACYNKPWSKGIRYPIGAGRIIMDTKVELNKSNFTRFLNDVLKGKYSNVLKDIKKKFTEEGNFRTFQNIKYFPYGFDELFTNKYLYPIFKQYKRIISFELELHKFLYANLVNISNKEKKYMELYTKSWKTNLKQDEYKYIVKTADEIYNKVKNIDLAKTKDLASASLKLENLEVCKRDYEDHYKQINNTSYEAGISALLIKKANQE